ncbi:MAG: multiheme c-type cytochrome [Pseudomonadota bacterium]
MIRRIGIACMGVLVLVACGQEGPEGAAGKNGVAGDPGTPCYEGLTDQNGDGIVDVLDCRGSNGQNGGNGQNGSDGQACWDLNGNGVADVLTEDANADGLVDVLDCRGTNGSDGQDYQPPTYVGWEACATCHQALYDKVARSGHGNALRGVSGVRPPNLQQNLNMTERPANGNAPTDPPAGYTWADISYLIGGWGWMVRFVDQQGYVITCPKGDTDSDGDGFCDIECGGTALTSCGSPGTDFADQWNLATDAKVPYERGTYQKTFDCAPCHTTGFDPTLPTLDASGNIMHGILGSWKEEGVTCERCHGPGSRHIGNPRHEGMVIERDAELCGECHTYGTLGQVAATVDGFVEHTAQFNELYTSKKFVMRCIDCHDPHQSAHFADNTHNPNRSVNRSCEVCHFEQKARQNDLAGTGTSLMASMVTCVDCHMPYLVKSAEANATPYKADMRSHLFAINTDVAAPQLASGGSLVNPYLTLTTVCRSCHKLNPTDTQPWSVKSDAELTQSAAGYHD